MELKRMELKEMKGLEEMPVDSASSRPIEQLGTLKNVERNVENLENKRRWEKHHLFSTRW